MALLPLDPTDEDKLLVEFVENAEIMQNVQQVQPNNTNNLTITSNIQNVQQNPPLDQMLSHMFFLNSNVTINYNFKQ